MTKRFDAVEGDSIQEQGFEFIAKELDGHHILYLEVLKLPERDLSNENEEVSI
ncbi:hypothetical protein D3C79_1076830 [compost metagenome]